MADISKSHASVVAGTSNENTEITRAKGKGRPKGTPNKKKDLEELQER